MALLKTSIAFITTLLLAGTADGQSGPPPLPQLVKSRSGIQLHVDGQPFLMLAGELHNSSASSAAYMRPIWDKLAALNLNTVIGTVSWELSEAEPGKFDFSLVDDQIAQAHGRNMRLVLIWFASYKNAESRYVPAWIRKNSSDYPRVVLVPDERFGSPTRRVRSQVEITPFSPKLLEADIRAFAALMRHLREVDQNHTVIMVQVENEVGVLGDTRDRLALAEAAWQTPVPVELMTYLTRNKTRLRPELAAIWGRRGYRATGSWAEVFGTDWEADEIFMAWQFGRFVGRVAEAGKKELALPMYANAWLGPQPGQKIAGQYPSGGPVARMMDVWKAAAPAIDFLAPDIYVDDVRGTYEDFAREDNPLFPPETQPIMGSLFEAIGRPSSLGYSIFGIEDVPLDGQIAVVYRGLRPAISQLLQGRAKGDLRGFALEPDEVVNVHLRGWDVRAVGTLDAMKKAMLDAGMTPPRDLRESKPEGRGLRDVVMTDKRPSGLILATGPDEFLIIGSGFNASFSLPGKPPGSAEIESVDEGSFVDGRWVAGRRLNGDEQHAPLPVDRFSMIRIKLLRRN